MRDDNVFFAEKTQKELEFKDHMAVSKNGRPRYNLNISPYICSC